ncbi:MAG: glycosyltransferase family 4 protein [Verrucomicrobiota bacterium]
MKVAIISEFPLHSIPELGETFRPNGHYPTWLPQIAEGFADFRDIDVHWLVLSSRIEAPRKIRWQRQTFHLIPTAPRYRAWTLFARDRKAIRACLDEIQPDLVHGWGSEDIHGFAAATSGRPNIVSMQGMLSHLILKGRMHPRVYLQALIELFILFKADRITVESTWGRTRVLHRNPLAQVENIECGVQNVYCNARWCLDSENPAAIFVGRIDPMKGVQDAVAAFSSPALAHAELWIVGDGGGAWYEDLKQNATGNVKWLGRKSSEETAKLMSKAWCLVLPTRADSSPNVVKEARMIGLPVLSTPCGGQITYIQHGENGYLVKPGDTATLAAYLVDLLGSFEKTKAFGACRHEEHRATLHPMETARKFYQLYQTI